MTLGQRIKAIRGQVSRDRFAPQTGISKTALVNYESDARVPGADYLNKLLELFPDINPAWLLADEGAMKRGEFVGELIEAYSHENSLGMKVFSLAGAGSPNELIDAEPVAHVVVPRDFYKPSIVPVLVRGRSMEDTILDGAIVGVDRADKWVISGEIYAVWLPYEGAVVKRLYLDTEKITCRSDNPKFSDFIVPLDRVDDHFIQGRVRWVIQKY